jgi:hypothetical protein
LRTMAALGCVPGANGCKVDKAPPMRATWTGSASLFVKSKTACVACPLMSLTPKTSALGKDAETETARLGDAAGVSSSSSTWGNDDVSFLSWAGWELWPLTYSICCENANSAQSKENKSSVLRETHHDGQLSRAVVVQEDVVRRRGWASIICALMRSGWKLDEES